MTWIFAKQLDHVTSPWSEHDTAPSIAPKPLAAAATPVTDDGHTTKLHTLQRLLTPITLSAHYFITPSICCYNGAMFVTTYGERPAY